MKTKQIYSITAALFSLAIATHASAHITGEFVCRSESGAYTSKASDFEVYQWTPSSFDISIESSGRMTMSGIDAPDKTSFVFIEGNAFGDGYYGKSYFSNFLLEPNGRFLFVQAMPNEAYMLTGTCR